MSDASEYQITMAGGDGDPLDAIQRRADDPFGTMKLGIGQVDADRDYLLAIVRDHRAKLDLIANQANAAELLCRMSGADVGLAIVPAAAIRAAMESTP